MPYSFISVFVLVNVLFFYALLKKRNDIVDVFWGPGIFLSSFFIYISTSHIHNFKNLYINIILAFILLWALRIFLHIGSRYLSKKEEDFRYKNFRESWSNFYLRSYFQIYILQGFLMISMSSIFYFFVTLKGDINLSFFIIGILIAVTGLYFETFADLELNKFLKLKKENKIKSSILKSGLWSRTRHPNYFGEVSFWWGIFLMCMPILNFHFVLFLVTPALITFLILYVSGIPMLEEKYKENSEFQEYKKQVPAFFPKLF